MTAYTHGHHESVLRSHRWRNLENSAAYLLPHLRPDFHVLDIGCGPGTITADFAGRVDHVTAVERADAVLDLARAQMAERTNVSYVVSDAHSLDLPDDTFDVVHAHQVLQHLADPVRALKEMRRVCKPDGIVAVRDSDYLGFTWFPPVPEFDEWMQLYQQAATANGGEPQAGRRLLSWARAAGFSDIIPSSSTWCFATAEAREYWGGMWADRILQSDLTTQLLDTGLTARPELEAISAAFRAWVGDPNGWFSVLHGEILARP
jgi:ubiquinone/menaquinone biosynthesis C-methylase UbiE